MRNSKIIIAKDINIDRSYNNVLSYTEEQMLTLVQSNNHLIASNNSYSFINRNSNNEINVAFNYLQCLQANYIAFQNTRYSNKWFFAFIDSVSYVSDKTTKIKFTVDEWSTWFDYWSPKTCFITREMVSDDEIGKHTIPENFETGEYIINDFYRDGNLQNTKLVIASTEAPSGEGPQYGGIYSGIYSGIKYYTYDVDNMTSNLQNLADNNKIDAVKSLFLAPNFLIPQTGGGPISDTLAINNYEIEIEKPTSLNGYTPKNKRLLCYPFTYLLVSNNQGASAILQFEKFSNEKCKFRVVGCLTPGCSIRTFPLNYNGVDLAIDEGINLGKYPELNWVTDNFTNWLTQNGLNVASQVFQGGLQIGSDNIVGGALTIGKSVQQVYQASKFPPQSSGNINSGDVTTASHQNTFTFYTITIKEEYAKIIDDCLERYGYAINRLKVPNIQTRSVYNYLQIADKEEIGYSNKDISVPSLSMEIINNAVRQGITIWHNHEQIGDFSLPNN